MWHSLCVHSSRRIWSISGAGALTGDSGSGSGSSVLAESTELVSRAGISSSSSTSWAGSAGGATGEASGSAWRGIALSGSTAPAPERPVISQCGVARLRQADDSAGRVGACPPARAPSRSKEAAATAAD